MIRRDAGRMAVDVRKNGSRSAPTLCKARWGLIPRQRNSMKNKTIVGSIDSIDSRDDRKLGQAAPDFRALALFVCRGAGMKTSPSELTVAKEGPICPTASGPRTVSNWG